VYITGEVRRPGTYKLPPGSRIEDAIRSAGGLTSRANTIAINLARRLQDEMQFNVPGRVSQARPVGDATKAPSESTVSTPRSAATTAPDDPSTQPSSPAVELTGPININTATAEELDALPGVGPSKAAAIVQTREEHGPFQRAEDLQEVSGIGPKLWETIKNLVTV